MCIATWHDYPKALSSYEKALAIQQQSLPPNHPDLASILQQHRCMCIKTWVTVRKHFRFIEKALEISQKSLSQNHPDLAGSHYNMGLLYETMGNYSKACSSYERAVEIGQKSLPSNHPELQKYRRELVDIKKKL